MKIGIGHSHSKRQPVYRTLRRQTVAEFKAELAQATGWQKDWIRWKRAMALEIRYNQLLFLRHEALFVVSKTARI